MTYTIKRCNRPTCRRIPWTCRTCGAACCEHRCTNKKDDGSATCSTCWRTLNKEKKR